MCRISFSISPKGNLFSMLLFSTNPGMAILKNNYFSFKNAAKFLILGDLGIPAGTNTGISTCSSARPRLKLKNLGMLRIISYNISIYFTVHIEKINIFIFFLFHITFVLIGRYFSIFTHIVIEELSASLLIFIRVDLLQNTHTR